MNVELAPRAEHDRLASQRGRDVRAETVVSEVHFGAPPRAPRYYSLDAWRGAACLAVVLYHSALYYVMTTDSSDLPTRILRLFDYGRLGVPVFFVISGYCITATADGSRRRSRTTSSFFVRRFRRIFPPYWVVLLMYVPIVIIVDVVIAPGLLSSEPRAQLRPWWFSASQWVGNLTLTETWRAHLFGSPRAHFVGQSWTLCYEEQFYAIAGALLCLSSRRFFSAALVVTVAAFLVQCLASLYQIDVRGFFWDGSWLMFAAGVLVYFHINYAEAAAKKATYLALVIGIVVCLVGSVPMSSGCWAAFGFALLILVLHPRDQEIANSKWLRPFAYCGTMCYSLYLVHELVVRVVQKGLYSAGVRTGAATLAVTVPACVVSSLLVGWGFYLLVERRFLNPKIAS
jgi:peptidoglycan/LPS O-acetylase OafA/YrhL